MRIQYGIVLSALFVVSCNPFSIIDKPSGDAQLLSAARGCFDRGDYSCAATYYGQISSASSDQSNAETAFMELAQNGATMGAFMSAVVTGGSGGKMITRLAGSLSSGAGSTRRLAVFHAYQKYSLISDTRLKGLVRFVGAMSLMAEMLGEDSTTPGTFTSSQFVTNPTTCRTSVTQAVPTNTGCSAASTDKFSTGTSVTLSSATDSQLNSTNPTLYLLDACIREMDNGLTQMGATGGVGSTSQEFAQSIIAVASILGTDPALYRGYLIKFDIGAN